MISKPDPDIVCIPQIRNFTSRGSPIPHGLEYYSSDLCASQISYPANTNQGWGGFNATSRCSGLGVLSKPFSPASIILLTAENTEAMSEERVTTILGLFPLKLSGSLSKFHGKFHYSSIVSAFGLSQQRKNDRCAHTLPLHIIK